MPRYPKTAASAQGLSDRVFSRLAARAKKHDGYLYPLHVGDTWREPLEAARAEAQRTADHPRLHNYSPVQGEPALIEAIEKHLQRRGDQLVDRDSIQVTSGATSGLSVAIQALVDPGDEVILPSPFWPLIRGIIHKRGATPVQVPMFDRLYDEAFDAEAVLEEAITEKTTAIYVNTPHNPTGHILPETVVAQIAAVAERHSLWILTDEVYEDIYFASVAPEPLWARADYALRTVAVHSMSKAYGLAGARVGWAHGPPDAMLAIRGVQTFSTYCASRPMQLGAAVALNDGREWLEDARASYREAAQLTTTALGLEPTSGGTFVFFDVEKALGDGEDTIAFLERCMDAGVLLTPGAACGKDFATWVRLCFTSVPHDELKEALSRLAPLLAD